ncbi:F-box protein SKIP31 [Ananas comosus]|uniref:F-box protein SKIP31 n=1 Tax=Ananas comosus TaxID=4615 RepID=A0A199VQG0_ANACO|nr:F-box protein SKIP31 [Ananas comosus]
MADRVGEDGGDDDDDEFLANFLESEILSGDPDPAPAPHKGFLAVSRPHWLDSSQEEATDAAEAVARPSKRIRVESESSHAQRSRAQIDSGFFSKIPPELFHSIFKFLSSEDLISCSLVCRFMNFAASDESLWRRLYCMRWGLTSVNGTLRSCAWKKLYIQRDQEDMVEFVRNTPSEFKEYYIQMQAAKRSQAPLPSQLNDDKVILDRTVADQVSMWKRSRGLTDEAVGSHCVMILAVRLSWTSLADFLSALFPDTVLIDCSLLKRNRIATMRIHYKESVRMKQNHLWFCRFARAYLLGYNCADEKELKAALTFC